MANSTDSVDSLKIGFYTAYTIEGCLVVLSNVLIIAAVYVNKDLRTKEYYIAAGLALADGLYGMGYFIAGIRRLNLVFTGEIAVLMSAWDCMLVSHSPFFLFGGQICTLMLVVVSYDRYQACTHLAAYMSHSTSYATSLLKRAYGYCAGTFAIAIFSSYFLTERTPTVPSVCFSTMAVPRWYALYDLGHKMMCGIGSVVILLMAMQNFGKFEALFSNDAIKLAYAKKQARVTKMISIVIFCSLFLLTVPSTVVFMMNVFSIQSAVFSKWAPIMWMLVMLSSAVNMFIYLARNRAMRLTFCKMLCPWRGPTMVEPFHETANTAAAVAKISAVV